MPTLRSDDRLARWSATILSGSLVLLLAQAFVPIQKFVLRGDDAFYYFKVAANYPRLGFWSFDSIHTTNGVQPLWAVMLSALAQVLSWLGITGANALARIFVGLTVLLLFASCVVLFQLLRKTVSLGTGIASAGAFLFPMGIVWARSWGMESNLYALLLLSTIAYFHLVFLNRQDGRRAALLGLLLGLTVLSRLNAVTFVPCLLAYFVLRTGSLDLRRRLRLGLVIGGTAVLVTVPYFASNYAITGHTTPISGTVKAIETRNYLRENSIGNRLSPAFASSVYHDYHSSITWFIRSRAADGLWVVGARAATTSAPSSLRLGVALAFFILFPLLLGRPREWLGFLRQRFRRLSPFAYVLVFAVLDALLSIALYPTELLYAMVRWWLVPDEIVLVVLVATLVVASLGYAGSRLFSERKRFLIATTALAALLVFHAQQMFRFYWADRVEYRDWNLSYNDEMYRAAGWLRTNVPAGAVVGSWNAGVLGHYARQRVEDIDGLVAGYSIVPYIRNGTIARYIRNERLSYLADISTEFTQLHPEVLRELRLKRVYSHYSAFALTDYRIYRVLGSR